LRALGRSGTESQTVRHQFSGVPAPILAVSGGFWCDAESACRMVENACRMI